MRGENQRGGNPHFPHEILHCSGFQPLLINKDRESIFERPDVFDVGRERNPHLAFGYGTHHCLGHNLARVEASVAISCLLERTRSFERSGSEVLSLHPSPVFKAVSSLPIRLRPA